MKFGTLVELSRSGAMAVFSHKKRPFLGSIIITDKCNLSCMHCAVGNITRRIYPLEQIRSEMEQLKEAGVKILQLYGGEPFLWEDGGMTLRDLVKEAKALGFIMVNVVTNGTFPLDLPEADMILVSIDGTRQQHDKIRGETFDHIVENIRNAASPNICLYMAINQINQGDIEKVCGMTKTLKNVKAISFNFHTPYPGTEQLKLDANEKKDSCDRIAKLMDQGYPVLNLKCAFPGIVRNTFRRPCRQCVVVENGEQWVCGRCIDVKGLCNDCGFLFAAEGSMVFGGNPKAIFEMFFKYARYG